MPGIYWLNYFGKELCAEIGKEKIANNENIFCTELTNNQLALLINEPAFCQNYDARLRKEQNLASEFGQKYFFDRNLPHFNYQQVAQIRNKLKKYEHNLAKN